MGRTNRSTSPRSSACKGIRERGQTGPGAPGEQLAHRLVAVGELLALVTDTEGPIHPRWTVERWWSGKCDLWLATRVVPPYPAPPMPRPSRPATRVGGRRRLLSDLPRPIRPFGPGSPTRQPRALGIPADTPRIQGRRPDRDRREARLDRGSRGQRHLPQSHLPIRLQPPVPHPRLLRCRPAARGRRGIRPASSESCRSRGIRVVLDGVFNHASRGFFPFHDIMENGARSPWIEWFHVNGFPMRAYEEDRPPNYAAWWGLHALPKFNTANPQVVEYLYSVGEHWAGRGIDGWRLDVPTEISTPGFWEGFRQRVRAVNPDLYIVGEIWEHATDWIARGDRFDATMNYLFGGWTLAFTIGGEHRLRARSRAPLPHHPAARCRGLRRRRRTPARRLPRPRQPSQPQPARLARHASGAQPGPGRRHRSGAGDGPAAHLPRGPLYLLRRRDRPGGGPGAGVAGRLPLE